jgi:hypothetical protein
VDRFWTAVLLSGFVCYGSLPWLISRPPRTLTGATTNAVGVRGVTQFVLARVSHGLNTFPSGHVAVSLAAITSGTLYQRAVCRDVDLRSAAFIQFLVSLAVLAPLAIGVDGIVVHWSWQLVAAVVFLVVFASILAT